MTTFDAVSAHWPRPPRQSTQKSRRSHRSNKATSAAGPSSPLALFTSSQTAHHEAPSEPLLGSPLHDIEPSLPLLDIQQAPLEHDLDDSGSSSEEENPFEAFAKTQASQEPDIKVEIDSREVECDVLNEDDLDDEELERQRHADDAKHHAEEGQRFRATQAPTRNGDETDEFDDNDLDELFRRTVAGGLSSGHSTPRRRGLNGSSTPSTLTSGSSWAMESRRGQRDRRMREQAGLGDLRYIHFRLVLFCS